MRTIAKIFILSTLTVILAAGASQALAEEESAKTQEEMKDYQFKTVTTKEGLHFDIPADMPIVTRNGVTGPIPFEEYQYFKLKKLDERLTSIEKKIDDLRDIFAATKKSQAEKTASPQEKAGLLSST